MKIQVLNINGEKTTDIDLSEKILKMWVVAMQFQVIFFIIILKKTSDLFHHLSALRLNPTQILI